MANIILNTESLTLGPQSSYDFNKFVIYRGGQYTSTFRYHNPFTNETKNLGVNDVVIIFGNYGAGDLDFFQKVRAGKAIEIPKDWIINKPIIYTSKGVGYTSSAFGLIEKIHGMDEREYESIIRKYKINPQKYNFILAVDGQGKAIIKEKNENSPSKFWEKLYTEEVNYENFWLTKFHKNLSYVIDGAPSIDISEYNLADGFFFGDAYYRYGKRAEKNYFAYDKNLLTTLMYPTSVDKVLNTYNSLQNKDRAILCECTENEQTVGPAKGCKYSYKMISAIATAMGISDAAALQTQFSATAFADWFTAGIESALPDIGYVAPNGTTNAPQNYITNLNSYKIKFVAGKDNRQNKAEFIDDSNTTYKIQTLADRNTLYLGVDKSSYNIDKNTKEPLSLLPTIDTIQDLGTFGEIIDNLQATSVWDNSKSDEWNEDRMQKLKLIVKNKKDDTEISLREYFSKMKEYYDGNEKKSVDINQSDYEFIYYNLNDNTHKYDVLSDINSFEDFLEQNRAYWERQGYKAPYAELTVGESLRNKLILESFELVEAYTRGRDFLQESYTEVRPVEKDSTGNRLINFEDNYFLYKYSGREFPSPDAAAQGMALIHAKDLLLETDITLGEIYGRQTYFIEAIKYLKSGVYKYKDTFLVKNFLDYIGNTEYTEDDYEIIDGKIDLNNCQYYKPMEATYENNWCDCCFGDESKSTKECYYQKNGVCPYRFTSEKHPRRIKTLEQSKSNRFNLIQEASKVFEVYPQFLIEFEENGKVKLDDQGRMKKHIAYMTEKGSVNYAGFRYEKNLTGIDRNIDSQSITTKLYVEPIDSNLAKNGICTIQTAPDNIGKNSYILDLTYYTKKGLLNAEQTQRDIWGIDKDDLAFLPTIGKYNEEFDQLTDLITLNTKQLTELEAKVFTAVTGVTTALEERKKNSQKLYQFKVAVNKKDSTYEYKISDTYVSYLEKYQEQATILFGLIEDLFFSENRFVYTDGYNNILIDLDNCSGSVFPYDFIINNKDKYCKGELWWKLEFENDQAPFRNWPEFKEKIIDKNLYSSTGILGQYIGFVNQIKEYKKQQQRALNRINELADKFYKIYEPYIKEGTWTDSNYLIDNEYYWAACAVLHDSSKPQVSYDINVIDISPIEEFEEDYTIDIADTTYVEDIDFFGINPRTGLPNREKVIVSEITDVLDMPQQNNIKTQNYTSKFDDLFESITATVQSLTYNENTYKRASNFTAQQYIQTDSLQGTLDEGNLTLLNANDKNIVIDDSGTEGSGIDNKASKYRLTGEGLYFSTDGGQTWDIGVGPQGWNLDYAKFGQLDVSKVQIIDGKYLYFLWDKSGINAYRNPALSDNGLVDFARFNKYGLSLIEKGHVRLRAGYEFKNNAFGENLTGDYQAELPLTDQNVGFYLYNDKGQAIFKTETASEYNDNTTDYSARLSLKGEMFITNTNLSDDKIATGQTIASGKTLKLSQGYTFDTINAYELTDSVLLTNLNYYTVVIRETGDDGSIEEAVNSIIIRAGKTFSGVIYKKNSDTARTGTNIYYIGADALEELEHYQDREVDSWSGTIKNNSASDITLNINSELYNKLINGESITDLIINGTHVTPFTVKLTYLKNKLLKMTSVLKLVSINEEANYTFDKANVSVPQERVIYFDLDNQKHEDNLISYKQYYDEVLYYYWGKKEEVEIKTDTSKIATKDVGIFINNKLAASQGTEIIEEDEGGTRTAQIATSGNERVFMIGLRGKENDKTVFRNVISALKNGVLYIGGEIQSELGTSLGDMSFNTLPDKVRITNASMIVANNGYIWADWSKFFNIKNGQLMTEEGSLQDYFGAISNAFGHIGSTGKSTNNIDIEGYYLIDPLEEM